MVFHETEELVQVAAQSPRSQVLYDGFPFHHTDIKKKKNQTFTQRVKIQLNNFYYILTNIFK